MGFFGDLPDPPDPFLVDETRPPEWSGPPDNVVGVTVPLDVVLVNTGTRALTVGNVVAYPTGVALRVTMLRRPATSERHVPDSFDRLRFGVELPDGRRVTASGWSERHDGSARLVPMGGGGGGLRWEQDYWLWPLPPPGRVVLACAWPPEGIEEALVEVDAGPIVAAAERAVELWPDERPRQSHDCH